MSDPIDDAQQTADQYLADALRAQRERRSQSAPVAIGQCLNCDEPFDDLVTRWCDTDCLEDWQKRMRAC